MARRKLSVVLDVRGIAEPATQLPKLRELKKRLCGVFGRVTDPKDVHVFFPVDYLRPNQSSIVITIVSFDVETASKNAKPPFGPEGVYVIIPRDVCAEVNKLFPDREVVCLFPDES